MTAEEQKIFNETIEEVGNTFIKIEDHLTRIKKLICDGKSQEATEAIERLQDALMMTGINLKLC